MKIEDLKLMNDKDFYKLVKNIRYDFLSDDDKKYYDYVNKLKAKFLTGAAASILADISIYFNKDLIDNNIDVMQAFNTIGIICATCWFGISIVAPELDNNLKTKNNKDAILITKRLLQMLDSEDLKKLISIYKDGATKGEKISINYMYDRLEKLGMLNILNEIEVDNDVKYHDDSKRIEPHKELKNN